MPHRAPNSNHIVKCLPRMSWTPANLYNLYQRTYGPPTADTKFTKSSLTMFQQRWKAKQLVRGYHGDWIQEGKFKKEFLPESLPPIIASRTRSTGSGAALKANSAVGETVPLASLMFAEVEKRLDTVVFRCCFADSVYRARMMVVHGKVRVNGKKHTDPNTKLSPGDLISVDPSAVTTLQPPHPQEYAFKFRATAKATPPPPAPTPAATEILDAITPSVEASTDPTTPESPLVATNYTPAPTPLQEEVVSTPALPFHLPEYASPFLFIPPYIEPSFTTCSAIYLRHPTASSGSSEVPSPYEANGEVMKLAWEYYSARGRKGDKRPDSMRGKRLGA